MKPVLFCVLLACAVGILPAAVLAQYVSYTHPASPAAVYDSSNETEINGIHIDSGGVDDEGMARIESVQNQYSLKLFFVDVRTGAYLAFVDVIIADRQGNTVLQTTSQGPVLLAALPPGRYKIAATSEGVAKTHTVSVGKRGLTTQYFRFPMQN